MPAPARRPAAAAVVLVVLGGFVWAGCSSPEESGPPSSRVDSWLTSASGGSSIGTLAVDSRNVSFVIARHNPAAAVRTVCALLDTDAQKAIGQLPTPDTDLTTDLLRAYEEAAAAGTDCYDGAGGNTALLARSAKERAQLPSLLHAALDRIRAITGHTPSTSTTAPSDGGGDPFGGG